MLSHGNASSQPWGAWGCPPCPLPPSFAPTSPPRGCLWPGSSSPRSRVPAPTGLPFPSQASTSKSGRWKSMGRRSSCRSGELGGAGAPPWPSAPPGHPHTPLCSLAGTRRGRSASKPSRQPITAGPWYGGGDVGGTWGGPRGAGAAPGWCRVPAPLTAPSSQGIILVYDITDEKSFENIQNWMKSIKEVGARWGWGCEGGGWVGGWVKLPRSLCPPPKECICWCRAAPHRQQVRYGEQAQSAAGRRREGRVGARTPPAVGQGYGAVSPLLTWRPLVLQLAKEHGIRFFETSAKSSVNVEEVRGAGGPLPPMVGVVLGGPHAGGSPR